MAQSDHSQSRASDRKRPSLIDSGASSIAEQPALSVLAALDGKRPVAAGGASRRAKRWLIGLGAIALVTLGAFAWKLIGEPRHSPAAVDTHTAIAAEIKAAALPASAPPPMGNEGSPQQAGLESLPVAVSEPAVAAATQTPAHQPSARPVAKPRAKSERAGDKDRHVAKSWTKPPAAKKTQSPRAGVTVGAGRSDADVDLIAALVQHMNPAPSTGKGGEATIAELVANCRLKHGAEAQRCQRRICENYWGRAEACPRSAARHP